jgi:hypothetical protein
MTTLGQGNQHVQPYEHNVLIRSLHQLIFWRSLLSGVFFLSIYLTAASAATVTLNWDPTEEPSVAGYRIYYGSTGRNYSVSVPLKKLLDPNNPTYTLKDLEAGSTYYFAATAYDSKGKEQGLSAEVQDIAYANKTNVRDISVRLRKLEDVITPEGASEILNVARMKLEVLERSKFQDKMTQDFLKLDDRMSKTVTALELRMVNSEKRIDSLLYWILGGLDRDNRWLDMHGSLSAEEPSAWHGRGA